MNNKIDNIERGVSKYFNEGGWKDIGGCMKDVILYYEYCLNLAYHNL